MQDKTVNLNLDQAAPPAIIHVTQGDTAWRWHFPVWLDGLRWSIPSGATAILKGTKPDGHVFAYTGSISSNEVVVDCQLQMTICAGPVGCTLIILDSAGKRLHVARIALLVAADPEAVFDVASDSALPAYAEVLGDISELLELASTIPDDLPGYITNWLDTNVDPATGYVLDNTLTLPNAAAPADKVGELKSAFNADLVSTDWTPNITQGSYFKVANGAAASSDKYARTSALWNGHGPRKAIVVDDPTYEFCLALYDETGDATGSGYQGYVGYTKGIAYIPQNAKLFGISFRRSDNATLANSDITAISAALSALAATDTTLSVAGAPADAKASGDRLSQTQYVLASQNSIPLQLSTTSKTGGGVEFAYDSESKEYTVYTPTVVLDRTQAWKNLAASSTSLFALEAGKQYYIKFEKTGTGTDAVALWIRYYVDGQYYGSTVTLYQSAVLTIPEYATGIVIRLIGNINDVAIDCRCTVEVQLAMSNRALQEHMLATQPVLKILTLGDSIARGARNNNKGFVGDLGMPYDNIAVSGASISTVIPNYKNVFTQLVDYHDTYPDRKYDIIISNGGINDYISAAPMGVMPTRPVSTDAEAELLDKGTVLGAAAYLFYQMVKLYPTAQRFFLIGHKIKRGENGVYYPTHNRPGGDYTQQDLHDRLVELCNVYNVTVIDVYKDSMLNTAFGQYVSPTPFSDDHSVTDLYFVDSDGMHPLALGYKKAYIPLVRQAIQIGTNKA